MKSEPQVKSELMERFARSWDLAPLALPDAQLVTEEHVAVVEVISPILAGSLSFSLLCVL